MAGTAVDVTPAFPLAEHAAEIFKADSRNQRADGGKLSPVGMTAQGQGDLPFKSFVDEAEWWANKTTKASSGTPSKVWRT